MIIRYHHTQPGTPMLVAMLIAAVMIALAGYLTPLLFERWLLSAFAIGCVILAWLFSSLTVEVSEHEIHWQFGPGFWRYRIALAAARDGQHSTRSEYGE